jgi:hypothetical protein
VISKTDYAGCLFFPSEKKQENDSKTTATFVFMENGKRDA